MVSILESLGWNRHFALSFAELSSPCQLPGRVLAGTHGIVRVHTEDGVQEAVVAGRLRHRAAEGEDLPVVGDWVVVQPPESSTGEVARVETVLPRRSKLSRKVAGARAVEQVVAANVDLVFLVMGLDGDYNPRRLERFLIMVAASGARPSIVLNKADLCANVGERLEEVRCLAPEVPVCAISAVAGDLSAVESLLAVGETVCLLGSSGVGKSTLVNRLAGKELLRTEAVRTSDDRGRHTTTHRELFVLTQGWLLIDNPGVREIQLWDTDDGMAESFADVQGLARQCRFRDCNHTGEPGCAVRRAVEEGTLDESRLLQLEKLEREAEVLERRRDVRASREADRRRDRYYKSVQKEVRRRKGR